VGSGGPTPFSDFDEWFAGLLDEVKPSLVVGIARAAIRVLQLRGPFSHTIPIISHFALPFLPDSAIDHASVLLFDDSVVFGSTMKSVREYLLARGATVSCASYAVDRSTFYGDAPPEQQAAVTASPHSIIPLRYKHLLWRAALRRHHSALVNAILGSANLCLPKSSSQMTRGWAYGNEAADGRVSDPAPACSPVAVHEASAA
jgi:hypothetical protein